MPKAPQREKLTIAGPAGRLEAVLETPDDSTADRIAILCHPHPQHQGTMQNKVVHTLARVANDLGMPALRFNFRGVGASQGEYADGVGEVDDLLAVVNFARERWPGVAIWLAGFSFGAVVAVRAAEQAGATQLISIAPAVNILGTDLGRKPTMPWIIAQGAQDEIVPVEDVRDWVAANQPGPVLLELPEAGHFFHGQLVALRQQLLEALR